MYRRSAASSLLFLLASLLAGCGGGSYSSTPTTTPTTTTPPAGGTPDMVVMIRGMNGGNSFSANPATVKVGQTVSWQNADTLTHTATADGGAFNTGNVLPGATSAPIRMSTAGTFPYHCGIHPTMVGTMTVTP
jgi:plastocyanin